MQNDLLCKIHTTLGCSPNSIIMDRKIHRFGKNDRCWYIYFQNPKIDCCVFGDWSNQDVEYKWTGKGVSTSGTFKSKMLMAADILKEPFDFTSDPSTLEVDFEIFKPCSTDFPYLVNKGVRRHPGVMYSAKGGFMAIPFCGPFYEFRGFQRIYPDGRKMLAKGSQKLGAFYEIQGKDTVIFVAEGYATSASIFEATGCTTLMAIDCGNITEAIKSHAHATGAPHSRYVIVADNDSNRVGEKGALDAINALPGVRGFVVPNGGDTKVTDANDYATKYGIEALAVLLKEALNG